MSTFEILDLEQQAAYLSRFMACPRKASDYSFVNLWSWRRIYGLEWKFDTTLVWLRQTRKDSAYWAPVGNWADVDWEEALDRLDLPARMTRVPLELMEHMRSVLGDRIVVHEARNHWDYVYSVPELTHLKGPRFAKKSELVDQFTRSHRYSYVDLDDRTMEQAIDLQSEWCAWRDCEHSEALLEENGAIMNTFVDWARLEGVFGGGILVDGKMAAYTVGERLDEETLLIHYEKAAPGMAGAYQAINRDFLVNIGREFRYVNREQDLGEEGLRKAKLSYNPIFFLKKYEIELR
jgi:uncharacterized protein